MTLGELYDMLTALAKAKADLAVHNLNVDGRRRLGQPSRVEEAKDREREVILMNTIDDLRKQEIDPL